MSNHFDICLDDSTEAQLPAQARVSSNRSKAHTRKATMPPSRYTST